MAPPGIAGNPVTFNENREMHRGATGIYQYQLRNGSADTRSLALDGPPASPGKCPAGGQGVCGRRAPRPWRGRP